MWGIWPFRKSLGQNPYCGTPNLRQIRSNMDPQVFHQFLLKTSSDKKCFCTNIKQVLQRSFRALLKPWKPRYFSSEMVGATVVRFVNGQYNTIRTIQYLRVYCENTLSYTNGVLSQTKPKTGSVKARQLIYRYSTNNKLKARYGIFYNQNYNNKILMQ